MSEFIQSLLSAAERGEWGYGPMQWTDEEAELSKRELGSYSALSFALEGFEGDLSAAECLHRAALPEWDATISVMAKCVALQRPVGRSGWTDGPEAEASTTARAWVITILKAKAGQ